MMWVLPGPVLAVLATLWGEPLPLQKQDTGHWWPTGTEDVTVGDDLQELCCYNEELGAHCSLHHKNNKNIISIVCYLSHETEIDLLITLLRIGNTGKPLGPDVVLLRMEAARFEEVRWWNGMNP